MIQSRYGWTDEHIIGDWRKGRRGISYSRWSELLKAVSRIRREESRDNWKRTAFAEWLAYLGRPRPRGVQSMSFPVWLEQLGLGEEIEKPDSAEVVNEILDSFKERYGVKLSSLMKGAAK